MRINMDSTTLAFVNDILTGVYVLLTLILAGAAVWSIRVSSKQSREALNLAREQIQRSEEQSQTALKESRRQAREILYDQHKPLIIWHNPTADSASAKRLDSPNDPKHMDFDIENVGTGIAANIWSVISFPKSYRGDDKQYTCKYGKILVPNKKEDATFYAQLHTFNSEEIAGFSFYPPEDGLSMFDRYIY